MNVSTLVDQYLKSLISRNVSPLTYRDYSHYLNRYLDYAAGTEVSQMSVDHIEGYKKYLANYFDEQSGLSLKRISQNYMLIALRALIEFAREKGLSALTKENVTLSSIKRENIKVLEKDEIDQMLNLPDTSTIVGLRDRCILETLLCSGILVSELSDLSREDINFETKELVVPTRVERVIYLFERAQYWLEKYLAHREDSYRPLFIRYQGFQDPFDQGERMRLTERSIERVVEKYAKALGLRGKITPQSFRNYMVHNLVKEGIEKSTIQQVLGHESSFSTNQYIKSLERK